MDLQLDQFLFILRIVLVALIYLFLIQLILVVRSDLVEQARAQQLAGDGRGASVGASGAQGGGYLMVVNPGPMALRPGYPITMERVTTIGRGPTNTVVVDDTRISTEHVRITYQNHQWLVEDLKSTNMTFLNGGQVAPGQTALAKPGDMLVLGVIEGTMEGVVAFRFAPQRRTERR